MAVTCVSRELLRGEPLSAAISLSGLTADSEGFFYKPGDLVEICGNEQVKKATTTGTAFGVCLTGLSDARQQGISLAPDASSRVNVMPFKYTQAVIRCTAGEVLVAGELVILDSVAAGKVKKTTTKADAFGIVWIGGGLNSTIEVLF